MKDILLNQENKKTSNVLQTRQIFFKENNK